MGENSTVRVALGQSNYTVGDIEGNERKITAGVRRAREENADLVVFSELALVGYPPQDLVKRDAFVDSQLDALDRIAAETEGITALVGFVARNREEYGKKVQNAVAVCRDGEIVGRTEKRLLPTYDVFDEDRFFEAAENQPVHPLPDETELGVSVCEDAWNEPDVWERPEYHEDPIEDLVDAGASLLVNSSASPFYGGKGEFRERLFGAHARDHGKWLVFVNQIGANDELIFDGRSFVVAPDGTVACRLAAFEEDFAVYDVPLDSESPATVNVADEPPIGPAEIRSALALGIRDYVHKTGFEEVVVGLSGGIDSSLTAALAVDALGPESVLGVSMPTRYTSDASETDARELADNLGIDLIDIPIEEPFEAFESGLTPILDEAPSVTEENVQARIQGDDPDGHRQRTGAFAPRNEQPKRTRGGLYDPLRRYVRGARAHRRLSENVRLRPRTVSERARGNHPRARHRETAYRGTPGGPNRRGRLAAVRDTRFDSRGIRGRRIERRRNSRVGSRPRNGRARAVDAPPRRIQALSGRTCTESLAEGVRCWMAISTRGEVRRRTVAMSVLRRPVSLSLNVRK